MALSPLARRARIAAGVGVALALVGVVCALFAFAWHPSRDDFRLQGADVSADSGAIDWYALKGAGADFGYIRATTGDKDRDERFAANWAGAFEAGVRRGAIHRFAICRLAGDQAANFVTTVARSADTLPAALELEVEDTPGCTVPEADVVLNEIAAFIRAVETHTGKPVMLKLASDFDERYRVSAAIARPLWSRQMFFPPYYSARPWRMWQANPMRRVEGVERTVGWNVVAP